MTERLSVSPVPWLEEDIREPDLEERIWPVEGWHARQREGGGGGWELRKGPALPEGRELGRASGTGQAKPAEVREARSASGGFCSWLLSLSPTGFVSLPRWRL